MASEPMPEAAPVGGIAVPEEPELVADPLLEPLPEGMLEPDGDVEGARIGAGVFVSSNFFPQAPSANSAESANTVTAGLKVTEFMEFPLKNRWEKTALIF